MSAELIELVVDPASAGQRLDRFLAESLPERSRASIQKHIAAGAVLISGTAPRRGSATLLQPGERVSYRPPPPEPVEVEPEDIPLSLLFEDEHYLLIDKPAGLVVHPALGHRRGTLVNAVLHHLGQGAVQGDLRPGIVHRLDRGTTGVLAVAKHERAQEALARLFRQRLVEKEYLAVAAGALAQARGTLDTPYGRHATDRKRFSSRVAGGKRAITHYTTLQQGRAATLLEIRLETGRTHQIRVHFADLGHPLVGDTMYGRAGGVKLGQGRVVELARPALHARRLAFLHPFTGARLAAEAPVPADLRALIEALFP